MLLQKDNSFAIHHQKIQKLALALYRLKHRTAQKIMCELFNEANVLYNLLIVLFGPETLSYLGPKI